MPIKALKRIIPGYVELITGLRIFRDSIQTVTQAFSAKGILVWGKTKHLETPF